jgi:hypothetical protein
LKNLVLVLGVSVASTAISQDEVSLEKIQSSAAAYHSVHAIADAPTGDGWVDEIIYTPFITGTSQATASTLLDPAYASVSDPDATASAWGYNTALAGYGSSNKITSALCYRNVAVSADPDPTNASAVMLHGAEAFAKWKISESETGDTWIQADVQLVGQIPNGGGFPTEGVVTWLDCWGYIVVADTDLFYEMYADGTIHVYGFLSDLDGLEWIDTVYPGPVTFTVRQYIDPGVEFWTEAYHYSTVEPWGMDVFTINHDESVTGSLERTTYAKISHLEAYVGSP